MKINNHKKFETKKQKSPEQKTVKGKIINWKHK